MYEVRKRLEIAGSHQLNLNYESACRNLHGHNWIVEITLRGKKLDENGMLADFKWIKNKIHKRLDHKFINDVISVNPTAENIAKWICDTLNEELLGSVCCKVKVQESEGNVAIYIKEEE